jgi:predicted nucleic acid-binding protein
MLRAVGDTHTVIWYIFSDLRLSTIAKDTIEQIASDGHQVAFSSITLAEIVYLSEKGRISPLTLERLLASNAVIDYSKSGNRNNYDYLFLKKTTNHLTRTILSELNYIPIFLNFKSTSTIVNFHRCFNSINTYRRLIFPIFFCTTLNTENANLMPFIIAAYHTPSRRCYRQRKYQ